MMRRFSVGSVVLAAAALITPCLAAQATFVSPSQSLAFGLSIPDDPNNDDLYFSIAMPVGEYWAAVGLGKDKMPGTLVLMIYSSASGDNVTFSPRLATDHTEPEFYSGLRYETVTNATGLMNDTTYVYSAVCHNCRSWPGGGSIDINSTAQPFIFATGSAGNVRSDSERASVRLHYEHGAFTMDMTQATGAAGPTVLDSTTVSDDATTLVGKVTEGMNDYAAIFHAVIMIFCFVAMLPFGILILRVGEWVRWHGLHQGAAMFGVIVGAGLGIKTSTLYNRSRNFNTAHQVIGLLVFAFIMVQFTLGLMHHGKFKKTRQPTKLAPIHVWLGRAIVILGIANGFLGFPLALSSEYTWIYAGLVIAVSLVVLVVLSIKFWLVRRRQRRQAQEQEQFGGPPSYNAEPWIVPGQVYNNASSFEMGPMGKSDSVTVSETRTPL